MFYAIVFVTSDQMAEHNNGRFNTIGPIGPTPQATHDDVR